MIAIFEALSERMAARVRTHDETLLAAARRLTAGESVDDAAVDTALAASGKTLDDFRTLVELCQRRREWYATLDRGPAAQAMQDKLQATVAREQNAFAQVQQTWVARARELDAELVTATRTVDAAREARDNLTRPDNVPGSLAERLRQAHAAVQDAAVSLEDNRRQRREAANRHKSELEWAEQKKGTYARSGESAGDHERTAARAAKRVAELDAALPEIERAATAAEAELRRVEALALKV